MKAFSLAYWLGLAAVALAGLSGRPDVTAAVALAACVPCLALAPYDRVLAAFLFAVSAGAPLLVVCLYAAGLHVNGFGLVVGMLAMVGNSAWHLCRELSREDA